MQRILCAVDSSAQAPKVITAAVDLARRIGAKLILFRAVGIPPEIPIDRYFASEASLRELLIDQARHDLAAYAVRIPADLLQASVVDVGSPWNAICLAAKKHEVDLIVIGSHGYSGLDRVLGTTAAKVVNHADRCVLIARGESPFA
jgi:nucleotide-binding universal stress UspA family protein